MECIFRLVGSSAPRDNRGAVTAAAKTAARLLPTDTRARTAKDAALGDGAAAGAAAAEGDVVAYRIGGGVEDAGDRGGESARDAHRQGLRLLAILRRERRAYVPAAGDAADQAAGRQAGDRRILPHSE